MNAALTPGIAQHTRWTRRRLWALIVIVFAAQIGLIFWLSDRTPPRVQTPARAPTIRLAGPLLAELLTLEDPTLFALPHQAGFSGAAWLNVPPQKVPAYDWSNQPSWLAWDGRDLGEPFRQFVRTNQTRNLDSVLLSAPQLTVPRPGKIVPLSTRSILRLEGALAERRLLAPLELPAWAHPDLLTNTVVQVVIDADGKPVSTSLLPPGSGSKAADQFALAQAKAARFTPTERRDPPQPDPSVPQLTFGKLIFDWRTLPDTNSPDLEMSPPPEPRPQ